MNFSDYRISLDIHEIGYQHSLTVKRRDTRRRIFASFVEDSKPYIFSEDCRAVFTASKPDGNIVFNDCTIENNVICYHVTEQTVMVPGQVKCEFRLYGDDNALLTSSRFSLLVDDTVYDDDDIVESVTEVSTLTRLVGEATDLIAEVNASLENGEFIPKFEIGAVATLPAGSNATVEITGSADAPVLNFGIPQGDQGQAESLIPDAELSLDSTKPLQNKVVTAALNEKAKTEDVNKSLEEKVDKVDGKGLSANDFNDAYKEKLDGVAAGANKYTLPVAGGALGGVKNGGDISADANGNMTINSGAVSRTNLANDAMYSPFEIFSSGDTINANHIGKKLRDGNNTDYILNVAADSTIPNGAEIAVFRLWSKTLKIVFGSGTRVALEGETGFLTAPTLAIPEKYTTIAMEKVMKYDGYDIWHVLGNVEVVS